MLPISNVIRRLRRERDLTQEELASAMGVTFQSVSRWENGLAYPDMELIPKIARFFDVSTDVLFGTDREFLDQKKDAHYQKIRAVQHDPEEFYKACKAAYAEFPDEFAFGIWLCRCYTYLHIRPVDQHLNEIRTICRHILEKCTNEDDRIEAMQVIVMTEDEEKLADWVQMIPGWKNCREVLLEARYHYRNDTEKLYVQKQENFLSFMDYIFHNCVQQEDPEKTVAGYRIVLKMIDDMRDPATDVDAWLPMRAQLCLRLAAACFASGRREEGYAELENAMDLYVRYAELPIDTVLSYPCPMLDRLSEPKLSAPEDDIRDKGAYLCWWAYQDLTDPQGSFGGICEEARFTSQINRLRPYMPSDSGR